MLFEFCYRAPENRTSLYALLEEPARLLAGGTDLLVDIRAGHVRPRAVVDIKKVKEYHELAYDEKEGLSIGAAVRCIDLISSPVVREKYPLLVRAAREIGSPQIRNRATIMGNICTASPSGDMGPSLLCCDAQVVIGSKKGERRVPLSSFYAGVKKTVLEPHEVAERIVVPASMAGAQGGFEKLKRIKGHDLALASVALLKKGDLVRIAIGACAVTPLVLKNFTAATPAEEIIGEAMKTIRPIDDIRASKDYRLFMVRTFIARLLENIK